MVSGASATRLGDAVGRFSNLAGGSLLSTLSVLLRPSVGSEVSFEKVAVGASTRQGECQNRSILSLRQCGGARWVQPSRDQLEDGKNKDDGMPLKKRERERECSRSPECLGADVALIRFGLGVCIGTDHHVEWPQLVSSGSCLAAALFLFQLAPSVAPAAAAAAREGVTTLAGGPDDWDARRWTHGIGRGGTSGRAACSCSCTVRTGTVPPGRPTTSLRSSSRSYFSGPCGGRFPSLGTGKAMIGSTPRILLPRDTQYHTIPYPRIGKRREKKKTSKEDGGALKGMWRSYLTLPYLR